MRVLVASHEWEGAAPGGAQRAAAALAAGLAQADGVNVTLAAAVREGIDTLASVHQPPAGVREVLVTSETDTEFFSWLDPAYAAHWSEVLLDVRPDVVHLHHYYHVGMELPLLVRRLLPQTAIVMTMHEFLAICLLSGQMVDSLGHLCVTSSPQRCARCIGWPVHRTFARQDYVRQALLPVDAFITPSEFARGRYVVWGLAPESVRSIPNALALDVLDAGAPRERTGEGLRLAYIGQLTPTKGVDVLVEAIGIARRLDRSAIEWVDIYGGGADRFDEAFHRLMRQLGQEAGPQVRFLVPYAQAALPAILHSADAIVVPSVWWENSPVVIEEALARRVPVVCSDIGGMAEKVRDGMDGWHFPAGNAAALAEVLVRLSHEASLALPGMRRPDPVADVVGRHLQVYSEALESRGAKSTLPAV